MFLRFCDLYIHRVPGGEIEQENSTFRDPRGKTTSRKQCNQMNPIRRGCVALNGQKIIINHSDCQHVTEISQSCYLSILDLCIFFSSASVHLNFDQAQITQGKLVTNQAEQNLHNMMLHDCHSFHHRTNSERVNLKTLSVCQSRSCLHAVIVDVSMMQNFYM